MPNQWLGAEVLPCAISAMSGKIKDALKKSLYQAILRHDDGNYVQKNLNPFEAITDSSYSPSAKVMRTVILKYLIEGGMNAKDAKEFYEREVWLNLLMTLLLKFVEKYPNLQQGIDTYSDSLKTYPFPWRLPQFTSSLTHEPDLLKLFRRN